MVIFLRDRGEAQRPRPYRHLGSKNAEAERVTNPAQLFAENLARERERAGLSIAALAERAEIHRTHVGLLLRGKRLARLDTVVKLEGALGVEPGTLLRGIAWRPPGTPRSSGRYRRVRSRS
jgi:plasmid maintenance system antidote protein VapI